MQPSGTACNQGQISSSQASTPPLRRLQNRLMDDAAAALADMPEAASAGLSYGALLERALRQREAEGTLFGSDDEEEEDATGGAKSVGGDAREAGARDGPEAEGGAPGPSGATRHPAEVDAEAAVRTCMQAMLRAVEGAEDGAEPGGQTPRRRVGPRHTLLPEERRLLEWHWANLEYGCSASLSEVIDNGGSAGGGEEGMWKSPAWVLTPLPSEHDLPCTLTP